MAETELVKKWLEKANEDFGYASLSLEEEFECFP
jgi:HEPN domain-containing protein